MNNNIHISLSLNNLMEFIRTGNMVALTAPLVIDRQVFIGIAETHEDSYCLKIPPEEFLPIAKDLYYCTRASIAVHGLKRIWEYPDEFGCLRGDSSNIPRVYDTKLLAYLLDPDSARSIRDEYSSVDPEQLTLAYLARRYLGENYPYRVSEIHDSESADSLADILSFDARVIYRLAQDLSQRMPPRLMRLYRDLELPLMVVLDDMRRVGIGFEGMTCAEEVKRTERSMALLAQEITGGQVVNLTAHEEVYRFLIGRGVPLNLNPLYVRRKGIQKPLEEIAHAYPLVRRLLEWWDIFDAL